MYICCVLIAPTFGCVLFAGAVRRNKGLHKPNDAEIEMALKLWLRYASDRDGGRSVRDRKPPSTSQGHTAMERRTHSPDCLRPARSKSPSLNAPVSSSSSQSLNERDGSTRFDMSASNITSRSEEHTSELQSLAYLV